VGADESDAWKACKYRSLSNDLEGNFVLAAAERGHVDALVTWDKSLLRAATVPAFAPADAIGFLVARTSSQ
jgi:hypothetical protein